MIKCWTTGDYPCQQQRFSTSTNVFKFYLNVYYNYVGAYIQNILPLVKFLDSRTCAEFYAVSVCFAVMFFVNENENKNEYY